MSMRNFTAVAANAGTRLDVVVASKYTGFTRSSLQTLFDKHLVNVNGESEKPSYKVHIGDKITVDETLLKAEPPAIELPVIYEDSDVIVIDKPSGVLTHSKGALNLEATIASFINPKLDKNGLDGNRAGIVHRLDRGTSGLIITAKNSTSVKKIQKQFSARKVKKQYLAIVEGQPEPAKAIVDAPIARNPKHPQTFQVNAAGKPAQTQYDVQKSFKDGAKTYSLVLLKPLTGRTHQLRVHMAYIGHPIVGDHVYGHLGGNIMLHATELELTLPSGERRVFAADPPGYFKEFAKL